MKLTEPRDENWWKGGSGLKGERDESAQRWQGAGWGLGGSALRGRHWRCPCAFERPPFGKDGDPSTSLLRRLSEVRSRLKTVRSEWTDYRQP